MKKIFTSIFALAIGFIANAGILGTFNGDLDVLFMENHTKSTENVNLSINTIDNSLFDLSIKNFAFQGQVIGDINFPGIIASTDESGITILSKADTVTGPSVNIGMVVDTKVVLKSCTISNNGVMTLNVWVGLYESSEYLGEESDVDVNFLSSNFTELTSSASVKGSYEGELDVLFMENHTKSTEIVNLSKNENDTELLDLSIKNFAFQGQVIGDIFFPGIDAYDIDGITHLVKTDTVPGPSVNIGMVVDTKVVLKSCKITSDKTMTLHVWVGLYESGEYLGEDSDVDVNFVSTKFEPEEGDGIFAPKAESLNIAVAANEIAIAGAEGKTFAIFNTIGGKVAEGTVANNSVNIEGLANGAYVITVGNAAAKFVKE